MKHKYNQKLPVEVEKSLDAYIERVKKIQWFKPSPDVTKEKIDTLCKATLSAFGVEASIEYRSLKTQEDYNAARNAARNAAWDAARNAAWDAARNAAWDAARNAAWDAARNAARNAAWDAAWDAARNAAWDASWDASWGAQDLLATHTDTYKGSTPFLKLVDLWEAGMYPCGVIKGKFVVYTPVDFTEKKESALHVVIDGVEYVPKITH